MSEDELRRSRPLAAGFLGRKAVKRGTGVIWEVVSELPLLLREMLSVLLLLWGRP